MEQEIEFNFPMRLISLKDMNIDWSKWTAGFGNCQKDREEELFDLLKIWKEKK